MPFGLGLSCECCDPPCFDAQATVAGNITDGSEAGSECASCESLDATYAIDALTIGGSITPATSITLDRAESLCLWVEQFQHCQFLGRSIDYQLAIEKYRKNNGDIALFVQQKITEAGTVIAQQFREGVQVITSDPVDETVTLTDTFNDNNSPFSGLAPVYCNNSATITVRVEQL